ncbi:MAG: hypothetical protein J6M91_08805 [Methanobrevibacter sp.]|nr:hypothetical protein [Methanobrevibacter sp.]MBP3226320.1 hypothetical protein [Methanobrevibacter sp.]
MTDENNTEPIEEVPQDNSNDDLKETLKKRLELELGLPLTPKTVKQVDMKFNDNVILLDDFPVIEVKLIKINSNEIASEDYILVENEGTIYLNETCSGRLYVEYTYGLPEEDYLPLLDLMVEYENDTSWKKDASSISEKNVSISYDTSQGKGARIQAMIQDLRNKYACVVDMI